MDLALNNLQRLICHKTKPSQTKKTSVTLISIVAKFLFNQLNPDVHCQKNSTLILNQIKNEVKHEN